jgi:hypothetical protein
LMYIQLLNQKYMELKKFQFINSYYFLDKLCKKI